MKVLKVTDGKISLSIKQADENASSERPQRGDRAPRRRDNNGPTSYKEEGNATTGLGALLKDIKL